MIDAFDLYQSFQSAINTFVGGWYRPNTDFIVKANDISIELWEKWTRQAEKSQEIKDNLRPFLKSKNVIVKSQNTYYGILSLPQDYERFSSAGILISNEKTLANRNIDNGKCDGLETQEEINEEYYNSMEEKTIELIDDKKWRACLEHITKKPTLNNPKMTQIDGGYKVAPRQVSVVVLDYYIKPEKATFVYTIAPGNIQTGAGDQIIYDKTNSKPFQWPDTVRNEFIIRLGEAYGLFTRDAFVSQVTTQQKMTA